MGSLRVAVDARPLAHPYTGIGQYLRRLMNELLEISAHRYFLYGNGADIAPPARWADVVWRTTRHSAPLLNHAHARFTFPRWARADEADVYFAPRHFLPPLPVGMAGVLTIHDLVWRTHPDTMRMGGRALERRTTPASIARADQLLTTTESVRQDVVALTPDADERLRVAPLAPTIEPEQPNAATADPHDAPRSAVARPFAEPYFVFCGTMEPRKNLGRLLAAYASLVDDDNPPRQRMLIISSGGWHNDTVKAAAERLGERVAVVADADDADKTALIAAADFLVQPSLHEGFGLPVADALALGTPVLAANTGALPEVAADAALYVDPASTSDIQDKLNRMCADANLRADLAAAARRRAAEFSWRRTAEITLAAIEDAAAGRGRRV
ncbi:MAG: glycosyltransferase family 1 protein [Pseudomonadota bacterium]